MTPDDETNPLARPDDAPSPRVGGDVVEGKERPSGPQRFPTIVLAGPGFLCLLFVLMAPTPGAAGAAIGSAVFFGVIAARAGAKEERTIGVLLAFLGPVLFCLTLMASL
jgi:hypothetical protein